MPKAGPRSPLLPAASNQVLQDLFQMRTVPESDRVHVRSAKEVDDALSVPVSVSVDHPMTDDDYIARIYVLVVTTPRL